jgi:hypothetical protein
VFASARCVFETTFEFAFEFAFKFEFVVVFAFVCVVGGRAGARRFSET